MNWERRRLVANSLLGAVALTSAVPTIARAADTFHDRLIGALAGSTACRVRYLNPEVSPQTIYAVPKIENGGADFDVQVKCFDTCEHAAKFMGELKAARISARRCAGPPYMRIDLLVPGGASILTMTWNYSGTCMMSDGSAYTMAHDLIWRLHRTPVKDW